jgi:hypothetical protein
MVVQGVWVRGVGIKPTSHFLLSETPRTAFPLHSLPHQRRASCPTSIKPLALSTMADKRMTQCGGFHAVSAIHSLPQSLWSGVHTRRKP